MHLKGEISQLPEASLIKLKAHMGRKQQECVRDWRRFANLW